MAMCSVLVLTACQEGTSIPVQEQPSEPAAANPEESLQWQGDWQNNTAYVPSDIVYFQGQAYINVQPSSQSQDPTNADYWELLAASGVDGENGAQGPQGIPGFSGLPGPPGNAGITWLGPWDIETEYGPGDAVSFAGASFININDANGTQSPLDPAYWELLADKGAEGVQGIQGVEGPSGLQGSQGVTGLTGPTGSTGLQGVPGPDGAIGPKGETGVEGPAGIEGPIGLTGPAGVDGADGIQGPAGMQWRGAWTTGTVYVVDDAVSFGGSSYINIQTTTGNEAPSDAAYWNVLAVQGDTGPTGTQGNTGADGAPGMQGSPGIDGQQGIQGPAGADGIDGADGEDGAAGPEGAVGPAGVAGTPGQQGAKGMQWQGDWVSGINYSVDDVVAYSGSSYIVVIATDGTQDPDNAAYFELVAQSANLNRVYRVVGFSTAQLQGNAGLLGMHNACQASFGNSARMATSMEVFLTPGLTTQSGSAWTQPVFMPGNGNVDQIFGSANSTNINNGLTCYGWQLAGNTQGLIVQGANYSVGMGTCNTPRSAVCAQPTTQTTAYEYVGFSATQVSGNAGYLGMHAACQASYGAQARMATSDEVFITPLSASQSGTAWVRPVLVGATASLRDTISETTTAYPDMNCAGWSVTTGTGLAVRGSDLQFQRPSCNLPAVVACSQPR